MTLTNTDRPNEFKLNNPPGDGITGVKFGPNSTQFLLVSSWDCSVRLYDVQANNTRLQYSHQGPVLDACFTVHATPFPLLFMSYHSLPLCNVCFNLQDTVHCYSGGLDKVLKAFDFNANAGT